jgi:hypothetical protein
VANCVSTIVPEFWHRYKIPAIYPFETQAGELRAYHKYFNRLKQIGERLVVVHGGTALAEISIQLSTI